MNRAVLNTLITVIWLAACGLQGDSTAPLTAPTLGEQIVLSPDDYPAQARYASADARRGKTLSMQCLAYHSLDKSDDRLVGPNLHGIFGRTAGSAPDYGYSVVLASSGIVWPPRVLDACLAEPFAFLPGNRMTYEGLSDGNDRNVVIAYLLRQTSAENGDAG